MKWDTTIANLKSIHAHLATLDMAAVAPLKHMPQGWIRASGLEGEPPAREWLVNDLIPSGAVTLLSGSGGLGKSILALDLAIAAVTGRAWCGKWVARQGAALVVSAEDDRAEVWRRLHKMNGGNMSGLDDLMICAMAGVDAALNKADGSPSAFMSQLYMVASEAKPSVVVIDNLALTFIGDENNRAEASRFVRMLHQFAEWAGCAVVLLQHPSLTGLATGTGQSGSTAWRNAARAVLLLEGDRDEPDGRTLTIGKSNFGAGSADKHKLVWRDGRYVVRGALGSSGPSAHEAHADNIFLELMFEWSRTGRRVNPTSGPAYAPNQFHGHDLARGLGKPALKNAMNRLITAGLIGVVSEIIDRKTVNSLKLR